MQTRLCTLTALAALLSAGCTSSQPIKTSSPVPNQTARTFTVSKKEKLNYLLFLPQGHETSGSKRWPLLLFLHGAGERGTNLARVAVHGPPKLAAKRADFPFIVVSPQCPEDRIWSTDALAALVDDVIKRYGADKSRVYLTGLSMGGYGTWSLGLTYPEKFAAMVPICGGGQLIDALLLSPAKEKTLRTMGIWAFHGAKDTVVPPVESERMVNLLQSKGFKQAKLTTYPEAGHDAWTETYNNPELYAWLLQHQR